MDKILRKLTKFYEKNFIESVAKNITREGELLLIKRVPKVKTVSISALGLSMAMFLVLINALFSISGIHQQPQQILTVLFIFGVLSFAGMTVASLFSILIIVLGLTGKLPTSGHSCFILALIESSKWYSLGWLFGSAFTVVYNLSVLFYIRQYRWNGLEISFTFNPRQNINIIKSPIESEEPFSKYYETAPYLLSQLNKRNGALGGRKAHAKTFLGYLTTAWDGMARTDKEDIIFKLKWILGMDIHLSENPQIEEEIADIKKKLHNFLIAGNLSEKQLSLIRRDILPLLPSSMPNRACDFCVPDPPCCPYTILFVPNPKLWSRNGLSQGNELIEDPIIHDIELFLHTVDRALASFEGNEIVGKDDIWSRIRIMTYFPTWTEKDGKWHRRLFTNDDHLVDGFDEDVRIDGRLVQNLLVPLPGMASRVKGWLREDIKDVDITQADDIEQFLSEIDVIFALSASPLFTRSTALPCDFPDESVGVNTLSKPHVNKSKGERKPFSVKINNDGVLLNPKIPKEPEHECYSTIPGQVALNVLSARDKTFIHEFAHAMSSATNGIITDEYADDFETTNPDSTDPTRKLAPFYINRLERVHQNGNFVPVVDEFMQYNNITYNADLQHPSERENWRGCFPARHDQEIGCVMDKETGPYRFDKLLGRFIYDRLSAKINRPCKK